MTTEPARKKRKSRFGAPVQVPPAQRVRPGGGGYGQGAPRAAPGDRDFYKGPVAQNPVAANMAAMVAQKLSHSVNAAQGPRFEAKIPVPVDQEPGFNFIGMLIGFKGVTRKQLEVESGCKILFKGRGSSKDGNDIDGERPLYVHLVASDEVSINKGTARIKELLFDKKKRFELRQTQMGAHRMNTHISAAMSGMGVEVLEVPSDIVGLIIGKGGAKIRELQELSQCRIQIDNESDPVTPHLRNVTIRGDPSNVPTAKKLVMETIQAHDAANPRIRTNGPTVEHVVNVPVGNVGMIIGKGGETIRALKERTQCNIHVERDKDCANPQSPTRRVFLNGSQQAIHHAEQEIFRMLREHEAQIMQRTMYQNAQQFTRNQIYPNLGGFTQGLAQPADLAMTLKVPEDKIPKLIEANGQHIKRIERQTQCKVLVPTKPIDGFREVRLEGARREEAKARVDDVLGMCIPLVSAGHVAARPQGHMVQPPGHVAAYPGQVQQQWGFPAAAGSAPAAPAAAPGTTYPPQIYPPQWAPPFGAAAGQMPGHPPPSAGAAPNKKPGGYDPMADSRQLPTAPPPVAGVPMPVAGGAPQQPQGVPGAPGAHNVQQPTGAPTPTYPPGPSYPPQAGFPPVVQYQPPQYSYGAPVQQAPQGNPHGPPQGQPLGHPQGMPGGMQGAPPTMPPPQQVQ